MTMDIIQVSILYLISHHTDTTPTLQKSAAAGRAISCPVTSVFFVSVPALRRRLCRQQHRLPSARCFQGRLRRHRVRCLDEA
jgi:hypothetical protein